MIAGIWETYQDYLESDDWKEKRNIILADNPFCFICKNKSTVVHHKTYKRVGCERTRDLMALCYYCHHDFHNEPKKILIKLEWLSN